MYRVGKLVIVFFIVFHKKKHNYKNIHVPFVNID